MIVWLLSLYIYGLRVFLSFEYFDGYGDNKLYMINYMRNL